MELHGFYGYVLLASHTSCFLEVDKQNNCIFSVAPTPLNSSNLRMPMAWSTIFWLSHRVMWSQTGPRNIHCNEWTRDPFRHLPYKRVWHGWTSTFHRINQPPLWYLQLVVELEVILWGRCLNWWRKRDEYSRVRRYNSSDHIQRQVPVYPSIHSMSSRNVQLISTSFGQFHNVITIFLICLAQNDQCTACEPSPN